MAIIRTAAPAPTRALTAVRPLAARAAPPAPTRRTTTPRAAAPNALASTFQNWASSAQAVQAARQAPKEKPRSLFDQAWDIAANVPQGVAGLVKAGLTTAVAPARVAYDVAVHHELNTGGGGVTGAFEHYAPAVTGAVESIGHTGERLSHPGEYVKAVKEGRIVEAVVEDVANASIVLGAAGKALGAGGGAVIEGASAAERAALGQGGARAGGAAVAEDLAEGAGRVAAPPRPVATVTQLPTAEAVETFQMPHRGLAGIVERAGIDPATGISQYADTARTIQRTGAAVRNVARLGERVANAPALPYELAGKGIARGLEAVGLPGPGEMLSGLAKRVAPDFMFGLTEEGRKLRAVEAGAHRAVTDEVREALRGGTLADQLGVTEPQGRATLFALDRPDNFQAYRGLNDAQLAEALDGAYASVAEAQRPTVEDIHAVWDYADRSLPPSTLKAMDAVSNRFRVMSQRRTALGLADPNHPLNPAQTGSEFLPAEVSRLRRQEERLRAPAQRAWEQAEPGTVHQERVAAAYEALARELPAPGVAREDFALGQTQGKASVRDAAARAEHRVTLDRLERAVNEYEALAPDATAEMVAEAADRVDQLTERAGQIDEYVGKTRERPTPGVPRGEVSELRRRAKEFGADEARRIDGEIDQLVGDSGRPSLPARGAQVGGEYDWWKTLDPKVKGRMRKEGFMRGPGEAVGPDVITESINARLGTDMSVDEAMGRYVDAVRRRWDAGSGKGDAVIDLIAQERGMPIEQVTAALRGGLADYAGRAVRTAETALTDMRGEYGNLLPEEQTSFNATLDAMLDDPAAGWGDFTELLQSYLPGVDVEGLVTGIGSTVPIRDVADWMRSGETTPALAAAAERVRQAAAAELNARAPIGPKLSEIAKPPADTNVWKRRTGTTSTGETTHPLSPAERFQQRAAVESDRAVTMRSAQVRRRRSINYRNERIANLETELGRSFQTRVVEDLNRPAVVRMRNKVDRAGPTLGGLVGRAEGRALTGVVNRLARKYGAYDDVLAALDGTQRPLSAVSDLGVQQGTSAAVIGRTVQRVLNEKGVVLEGADLTALNDAVGKGTLLEDIDAVVSADSVSGARFNTPYRVADAINQTPWLIPDDVRSALGADMERYQAARGKQIRTIMNDHTAVMPAKYRTMAQGNQRAVGALIDMAERYNRRAPGSGDVFLEMAEDTGTTLAGYVEKGLDPIHLTGGPEASGGSLSSSRLTGERTLRATQQRTTGLRPLSADAYARLEAAEVRKQQFNVRDRAIMEQFGKRADSLPAVQDAMAAWADAHGGEIMPSRDIAKVAADAGYKAINGGGEIHPQQVIVPEQIQRQLNAAEPTNAVFRGLAGLNRMWKTWILPFSTKWFAGNVIGNAIMATFNAGIGPLELARQFRNIAKAEGGFRALWENEGLSRAAPNELANYGLTYQEFKTQFGEAEDVARTRIGRGVQRAGRFSFAVNQFVDNATRSAVFLAKRGEGIATDAAMRSTLAAMGDFTRMTNFERNYVRQVLPFYAWLRHSVTSTMKLPIHSPTRAAMLFNLANMYADPEMSDDLLNFLGNKIPLGGDRFLNVGGTSPYFDFQGNLLRPQTYTSAISPWIKTATATVGGFDLGQLAPVSRPPGTASLDRYGRPEATSPLSRLASDPLHALGEIGYIATQQAAPAPVRALRDLAIGSDKSRSDTGYATKYPAATGGLLSTILRGAQIPAVETIDVQKKERELRKQRARG